MRSAPDGARRGRLRITEAGELINEKYGLRPIALRIFEQAFNALSLAQQRRRAAGARRSALARGDGSARRGRRARLSRDGVRRCGVLRVLPAAHADRRHRAHADRLAADDAHRAQRHRGTALHSLVACMVAVPLHDAGLVRRRHGARAGAANARRGPAAARCIAALVLLREPDRRHRAGAGARRSRDCGVLRGAGR